MEAFAETLVARLVQLLRTPSPIGDTDAALGADQWLAERDEVYAGAYAQGRGRRYSAWACRQCAARDHGACGYMEIRPDAPVTGAETQALDIEVGDLIAWDPRATVTQRGCLSFL